MADRQLRILHVLSALHTGGVENMLLTYYSHMSKRDFHFDFVVHRDSIGVLESSFEELGSRVYHIPALSESILGNLLALRAILKSNDYDCVHFHLGYYAYFSMLLTRKMLPEASMLLHSHIALEPLNFIQNATKVLLTRGSNRIADVWCACGHDAGVFQYGGKAVDSKRVNIVFNAIEIGKFEFDFLAREVHRDELKLKKRFVLGHVGRLTYQKNQQFLVDVFNQVHDKAPDAALVLIGAGEDEENIEKQIQLHGLEGSVYLLGARLDAYELFNAFDMFVLPSRYEGLGITLIEAQANGLKSLASTSVPNEVNVSGLVEFLPLDIALWVDRILSLKALGLGRTNNHSIMMESNYNILNEAKKLEDLYVESKVRKGQTS